MSNTKFFICRHCGNLVKIVKESGVPMMCCGQKMEELVPNTTDAAGEKHVPVATVAVNGSENAALLAIQMLAIEDKELADKLDAQRKAAAEKVLAENKEIEDKYNK